MAEISITLPFPPSLNAYWRHPHNGPLAGRHLIGERGRKYRMAVTLQLLEQFGLKKPKLTGRLKVAIEAYMPDRRKRDLDNIVKALLDSLTHAGVWLDDSQIDDLRVHRNPMIAGMVKVCIEVVTHE